MNDRLRSKSVEFPPQAEHARPGYGGNGGGRCQEEKWYALYVKSRTDFVTEKELRRKGIETYLPTVTKPRQWKDRRKLVDFPLFPGYLFFRVPAVHEKYLTVLKTKGAVTILSQKPGVPVPVPDREIESLKALTENDAAIDVYPHLNEGTPVRVRRGPLKGAEGILLGKAERYIFVVNVELLGRSVGVRIFADYLESA